MIHILAILASAAAAVALLKYLDPPPEIGELAREAVEAEREAYEALAREVGDVLATKAIDWARGWARGISQFAPPSLRPYVYYALYIGALRDCARDPTNCAPGRWAQRWSSYLVETIKSRPDSRLARYLREILEREGRAAS